MNYFELKNIKCTYEKKKPDPKIVLEIEQLEIPKGKVIFIIGPSGCGKSTILETLGLMNDTVVVDEKSSFNFFTDESSAVKMSTIWQSGNNVISKIRRDYFSFIFQHTNLMRNFTIEENSIIPKLIKGGDKKFQETLVQIGLEQIINERKVKTEDLSGGQQQRLAFVRAIMPKFKILFGDEPTGNLDSGNAENLIKIIDDEIHKDPEKTAIIVSHSIELAVTYADVIIKIDKRVRINSKNDSFSKYSYGLIDKTSVFTKVENHWQNNDLVLSLTELLKKLKSQNE